MKKLLVFIVLAVMLSSCSCSDDGRGDYDDLNKHKGEVVVSRKTGDGNFLYLKKENDANLVIVRVSYGEYDYYKDGDTIK